MRSLRQFILAVPITLAPVLPASAVVIAPGGGLPPNHELIDLFPGAPSMAGETIASRTTPWEVRVFEEDVGQELRAWGTLRHWVVREIETNYLAFHYRITYGGDNWNVVDAEGTSVNGFGNFLTDFRIEDSAHDVFVRRSADGESVQVYTGESTPDYVVIRTDALAFDEGGDFVQSIDFEPMGTWGDAHVPTFRPVPEPATPVAACLIAGALLRRPRPVPAAAPPRGAGR